MLISCWKLDDRLVAFCGHNLVVSFVDKMGEKFKDFPLKFSVICKFMEFDNVVGDALSFFKDKCSIVTLINNKN